MVPTRPQAAVKAALDDKVTEHSESGAESCSPPLPCEAVLLGSKSASFALHLKQIASSDACHVRAATRFTSTSAAFRVDLDDLGGEVCLLDWGEDHADVVAAIPHTRNMQHMSVMDGRVTVLLSEETASAAIRNFKKRVVPLEGEWPAHSALLVGN